MSDELDLISVIRGDLVNIERTLNMVYGKLSADDLSKDYSNMRLHVSRSPLSTQVANQLEKVRGYLNEIPEELSVPE